MAVTAGLNAAAVLTAFRGFSDRVRQRLPAVLQKANEEAARIYLGDQFDQFAERSRGGNSGSPWAPLALSTVRRKGGPLPILIDKGDLIRSLQPGAPNNVLVVTPDRIRAGTADPKARYHQDGTGRMPARKVIGRPRPDTVKKMQAAIVNPVRDLMHRATLKGS